jgi:hypothetical protein
MTGDRAMKKNPIPFQKGFSLPDFMNGLACFSAVLDHGCQHYSIVTGGGPNSVTKEEFAWVNTMIDHVKRSINGTYHAINPKHLPRYLAEFC